MKFSAIWRTGELVIAVLVLPMVILAATATSGSTATNASTELLAKFSSARELSLEVSVAGNSLAYGVQDVYKIQNVSPGYQLELDATGTAAATGNDNSLKLTLYSATGTMLSTDTQAAGTAMSVFYYPGQKSATASSETVYAVLEASDSSKDALASYTLKATKLKRTDANTSSEAGESISTLPITVSAGRYTTNYLGINACATNKYCSTDYADTFKLSDVKDQKLKITITPTAKLSVRAAIATAEGTTVADDVGRTSGGAISLSYDSRSEDLYLTVSPAANSEIQYGSYSLEVAAETLAPLTPTATSAAAGSQNENSLVAFFQMIWQNKILFFVALGIIIVVIVLIVLLLPRRRRGSKAPEPQRATAVREVIRDQGRDLSVEGGLSFSGRSMKDDLDRVRQMSRAPKTDGGEPKPTPPTA